MTADSRCIREKKQIRVPAVLSFYSQVSEFVEACLESSGCPQKVQTQLLVAIEELFVNVVHYAYPDEPGDVCVDFWIEVCDDAEKTSFACVRISDHGIPFNLLKHPDPDITLSAGERAIGGLGIYMVKKSMDEVEYEYKEGRNIVTIKRKLNG